MLFSRMTKTFMHTLAVWFALALSAQALDVTDTRGIQTLDGQAERVIALNWGATEQMIELGVAPVGVADIGGYREWVTVPAIADGPVDVGRRAEPNLELISSLKPDLIIIGSRQESMIEDLEEIAPVLYFDNFRSDHKNIEAVDRSFVEMGKALGKETVARDRLAFRSKRIAEMKQKLTDHHNGTSAKVAVIRFVSKSHARVYGANSMVEAALDGLGLEAALPIDSSRWGQAQRRITDFAKIKDGSLLYFKPFAYENVLHESPIWQNMPFVENDKVGAVEPAWTYGGAMSVLYIAERITDAMLAL